MRLNGSRWALGLVALVVSLVVVQSTDQRPASALVPPPAAPVIAPVAAGVAAGVGTVAVAADALGLCGGAGFDCSARAAEMAWDIASAPLRLFSWGRAAESSSFVGSSTSSTYGGGSWTKVAGASKTAGLFPNDGIITTYNGVTLTSTILFTGPKQSVNDVQVKQAWSGGYIPNPSGATNWYRVSLSCWNGQIHSWQWGHEAYATGATSGEIAYTFDAACSIDGGLSSIRFYVGNNAVTDFNRYEPGTLAGSYPSYAPAPDHKWRTSKVCAIPGGGSPVTVTAYSRTFKEADSNLPNFPNPQCPAGKQATEFTVYEGDETGAGGVAVFTWTAPDLSDPALVEYSDCLPGGSAYPCVVKLLKVTPQGNLDCGLVTVDCRQFDPSTSTTDQWQCTWGTHVVPLSQCAGARTVEEVQQTGQEVGTGVQVDTGTSTPTQPGTSTGSGPQDLEPAPAGSDSDVLECIGGVTWNPMTWVFQPVKCAFKWAFMPDDLDWSDYSIDCSSKFPCNLVESAVDAAGALSVAWDGGADGGVCGPWIGFDSPLDGEPLGTHLPSPSCPTSRPHEAEAADLFGWRVPLRTGFALFLWIGFAARMYRQLPWARHADVPFEGIG